MPKKQPTKNGITAKKLAEKWGLTEGRISQLVGEGMPLSSVAHAAAWRRERWTEKSGELPAYLLTYRERVSIEQRIYDEMVYTRGVAPLIAAEIASEVNLWNPLRTHTAGDAEGFNPRGRNGADRAIEVNLESLRNEPVQPTWFIPILVSDSEICPSNAIGKELVARATEIDRAALREEGIIK